jgi:tetratricopeptide (TPR) repeat protein
VSFTTRLRERAGRARLGRVLALYGSGGFVALQVVELFSNQLGLPTWLFVGVLAILATGLPIVVVTALMQAPVGDPARTALVPVQSTPDATAVPGAPVTPPAAKRGLGGRWFTWRNAWIGAAAAFGALALTVATWMTMRSLGIGPVGSLLAAGVLVERDPILIAAFDSPVGDTALAAVVTEAFRIDLSQSRVVALYTPQQVQQVLQRMQRPADARIDRTLAREVAAREGLKAFITGEVNALGRSFVLTATLVSAESGDVLTAVRESAADSAALIGAIDRLSKKLRERIGESLRTIRRAEPLATATTGSLEALRKYTQGVRAYDVEGDYAKARTLLEDAVRIDTTFAMAYRKLGVVLASRGLDRERALEATRRAFELSGRLPDVERYLAIGTYHMHVTSDYQAAATAYRALLDTHPEDAAALNNLSLIYLEMQDYEAANEVLERAMALDSSSYQRFINLSIAQHSLGRYEESERTLEAMHTLFPANPNYYQAAVRVAAARLDHARALELVSELEASARTDALLRAGALTLRAGFAVLHGRFDEGQRLLHEAESLFPQPLRGLVGLQTVIQTEVGKAIVLGTTPDVARVDALLREVPLESLDPTQRPTLGLAHLYTLAGETGRARRMLEQFEREAPAAVRSASEPFRRVVNAEILFQDGRVAQAITELRQTLDGRCPICGLPGLGRAFEMTGQPDSAVAAWERYVESRHLNRIDTDLLYLPLAYERLAGLYDAAGDHDRARLYYGRFIVLWEGADPVAQPRVRAARERLARLVSG